ncbi:MAG TPA: hypothetical protein VFG34_11235 [Sphingopyxis sp.]|nr:hypothetical protein [Sphingopyxis sp.]
MIRNPPIQQLARKLIGATCPSEHFPVVTESYRSSSGGLAYDMAATIQGDYA